MNPPVFIYGLRDSRRPGIRYVGQTADPVGRMSGFRTTAKTSSCQTKLAEWIRGIWRCHGNLELTILQKTTQGNGRRREDWWIRWARSAGEIFNVNRASIVPRFCRYYAPSCWWLSGIDWQEGDMIKSSRAKARLFVKAEPELRTLPGSRMREEIWRQKTEGERRRGGGRP